MQASANTFSDPYEEPGTGTDGYTTNGSFPTNNLEVHSVTYYDDYDFDRNGAADYNYAWTEASASHFAKNEPTDLVRGMVTGVKVKILDKDSDMPDWLWTVTFYDSYGRELQTQADNHLGGGDTTDYAYNFAGELLHSRHKHWGHVPSATSFGHYERRLTTWKHFTYDHRGRLLRTTVSIEDPDDPIYNNAQEILSEQRYDPLGQLTQKNLHNDGDGSHWQEVDYLYNIRGWLTHINELPSSETSTPSYLADDLFSLRLYYNETDRPYSYSNQSPQYNGNISGAYWWSETPNMQNTQQDPEPRVKGFDYEYDGLNRLIASDYSYLDAFSSSYSYDLNGNILSLTRYTAHPTQSDQRVLIDDLSYSYENSDNSNRLESVSDASNFSSFGVSHFEDGSNSGADYDYDSNGNLTLDQNQEISSIEYNHFNKPTAIHFTNGKELHYYYSADGTKLRQVQLDAGGCARKQTDYVGGLVYEDPDGIGTGVSCTGGGGGMQALDSTHWQHYQARELGKLLTPQPHQPSPWEKSFTSPVGQALSQRIQRQIEILTTNDPLTLAYAIHEEGRMRRAGDEMIFEYYLKDHLGNTRVMFGDSDGDGVAETLQEDHYYPFGLKMADGGIQPSQATVHLYNGKELQDELGLGWYDYGARMYSPTIGRWNGVDALAGKYASLTPFAYVLNSPLRFIDPNGMEISGQRNPSSRPQNEKVSPPDIYLDELSGDVLGEDGAPTDRVRLISRETFNDIKTANNGATTSTQATNDLQNNSRRVEVDYRGIYSQIWLMHMKTSNLHHEHSTLLILDLDLARIYATPGPIGSLDKTPLPSPLYTSRNFLNPDPRMGQLRLLAQIHGHPNNLISREYHPGVSNKDVEAAVKQNLPIYALKSWSGYVLGDYGETDVYRANHRSMGENIPGGIKNQFNPTPVGKIGAYFTIYSFDIVLDALRTY